MSRTAILHLNTTCDVADTSRHVPGETPLEPVRRLSKLGWSTISWLVPAVLVAASMSHAQASADHARYSLDARQAGVSDRLDAYRMAGRAELTALPLRHEGDNKSMRLAQAATTDRGEPQQSPEQPRGPGALSCELNNAKHDIELLQGLAQEHDRAEQLEQALAEARSSVEAQTALAKKASDEVARLKQAAEGDFGELQKNVQQERERIGQLEQALAAARRDIDAQTALAAKAGDEVARLTLAAKADAAEQQRSMQKEHERADALAQDLSMARSKIYAYEAQAAKAGEEAAKLKQAAASDNASLEQSQQRERERADRLARDLAKASRDLDSQTERASKASEEVAWVKQAGKRDSTELRSLLQRERERAEELERNLALARRDNGGPVAAGPSTASQLATTGQVVREGPLTAPARPTQDQPVQDKSDQDKSVQDNSVQDKSVQDLATAAPSPGDAQVGPDEGLEVARLMARASLLLEQGDIGAARIVLEHVAGMGNAQATFALAETYDPLILPNLGTYGTRGDATKARDLYAQAEAGGIKEAKARSEALRR